jgi:ferredoxin
VTARLVVDWPLCQAHGLCAEVLPEVLALDEWGYPVVLGPLDPQLRDLAAAAEAACPVAALRVTRRRRSRRSS